MKGSGSPAGWLMVIFGILTFVILAFVIHYDPQISLIAGILVGTVVYIICPWKKPVLTGF